MEMKYQNNICGNFIFKLLLNQLGKDYVRGKFFAEEGDDVDYLCCKDFWITTDEERSFLRFGRFRPAEEVARFIGSPYKLDPKIIDSILSGNMSKALELIMTRHSSLSDIIYKNLDKRIIDSNKFKIYQVLGNKGSFLRIHFYGKSSEDLFLGITILYHTSYVSVVTNNSSKLAEPYRPNERDLIQVAKLLNNYLT